MCVNVIQLYFQFLINNNKWVREHYSAHCALMKRFDSRALILMHLRLSPLKKSMSWANSVLQRYPKMLLFFFFMLQTLWQPGRSWKESLIQHCLWWTESVHPRIQSTCSTVQSGCCSEKKKRKSSLPLSPEHSWMPILSCCNTGEFNSYPDNVVNQLEVLVPWGYSH